MPDGESPLDQLSVLVTRPSHQSQTFCNALQRAGAATARLPTIEIVYSAHAVDLLANNRHDLLIFTSANAVRAALQTADAVQLLNGKTVAAIGPVTSAALAQCGVSVDITPTQHNSEGMLAALSCIDLRNVGVAILRGDSGRHLLYEQLQPRAHSVDYLQLYQRRLPAIAPAEIEAAVASTNVTTVSSDLGLLNLVKLLPPRQLASVRKRALIVNSHRCAKLATEHGFQAAISVANPPGDNGQLQAQIDYAKSRRAS